MAFCNSCGATLNAGTQFCNKCGAAVTGNPADMSASATRPPQTPLPAPPPSKGGSSALKIILIVVGVVVGVSILGMVTCGIVVHRAIKNARVSQSGDKVKVETPFGNMETSTDPDQVAKDLGVDIYPGAEPQKGAYSESFGSIHTATAFFRSTDSTDKVCDFYKSKLPTANVTTSDTNRCTIVSQNPPNMTTINVESNDAGCKIQITSVKKTNQ